LTLVLTPAGCGKTTLVSSWLATLQAATLLPIPILARTLIVELDQSEESSILVLDDYHRVQNMKGPPGLEVDGSRVRCSIKAYQILTLRALWRAT
jgi:ATP/maltotriose-dependent transcriptional regulator MalT